MAYICKYCQQPGHLGLDCSLRPKTGQIWETNTSYPTSASYPDKIKAKIEVLNYKKDKNGVYFDGKCIESNSKLYTLGGVYEFLPQFFVRVWSRYDENLIEPQSLNLGAQCTKCKKDYPYADSAIDFVCWSCTNGY